MHNYERVCEEKLISKHKFIAINLSIDSNRSAYTHAHAQQMQLLLDTISEYDYN